MSRSTTTLGRLRRDRPAGPTEPGPSAIAQERIRVLHLIARMNVGGPALQIATLAGGHDHRRFESSIVAGEVEHDEADFLTLHESPLAVTRVSDLRRHPTLAGDARALRAVMQEVGSFRPHIVHTHTAKAGVLGRLAARLCHVPAIVHTFHGHLLHGYFGPRTTKGLVVVERALAPLTDRLVTVGAQVRDDLLAAGVGRPDQYRVVPPGVRLPVPPERETARRALGLSPEDPLVVLVARLTAVKRPDRFVDVALHLAGVNDSIRFAIAGEGELLGPLRQQARPLGSRLSFLGWRPDVETVYAAADVVVLTSDNEGTPLSLIEAAHARRAAVTTGVGSAGEVVIHGVTGLVTSTAPADLAGAVRRLLEDAPRRERMATAAAERARHRFGVDRFVADTERIYEELGRENGFIRG